MEYIRLDAFAGAWATVKLYLVSRVEKTEQSQEFQEFTSKYAMVRGSGSCHGSCDCSVMVRGSGSCHGSCGYGFPPELDVSDPIDDDIAEIIKTHISKAYY
jgi:hypothetical protein